MDAGKRGVQMHFHEWKVPYVDLHFTEIANSPSDNRPSLVQAMVLHEQAMHL